MPRNPRHRPHQPSLSIPDKATRLLHIILIALGLIVVRIWYLSVIQYEVKLEEARKPQRRTVDHPANRGTIRDCFNIPLAVNKVQYQAAILYSQLRQIPAIAWEPDGDGVRCRRFKRREYIQALAALLADELNLDATRVEDLIYSKAALYYNIPYVIKEEVSERTYYRLRMLEKDWLGLQVRCVPKRHYPMGKVAADIIGYMGAINKREYEAVISEMNDIEEALLKRDEGEDVDFPDGIADAQVAQERLIELRRKAYSINDYVGKSGIEALYEQQLRGSQGRTHYYSDARGNFLRQLPGAQPAVAGQRFLLTISSELQAFTEELLIKHEETRQPRVSNINKGVTAQEPWIKGGAIVVMDPQNGDILAMASYPRFDPNDFIPSGSKSRDEKKRANVLRWFETERYIGDVWNQQRTLMRERYDITYGVIEEERHLSWDAYLELTLTTESPLYAAIQQVATVGRAVELQRAIAELIVLTGEENVYTLMNLLYHNESGHEPHGGRVGVAAQKKRMATIATNRAAIEKYKDVVHKYVGMLNHNDDKVLLIDICRLVAPGDRFSRQLLAAVERQPLSSYRDASAAFVAVNATVRELVRGLFHTHAFIPWREANQKTFLKAKRAREKAEKRYARPYLDYLDEEEVAMFEAFWQRHRWQLLTAFLIGEWIEPHPEEQLSPYLDNLMVWQRELKGGAHGKMKWWRSYQTLTRALLPLSLDNVIQYLQTLRSFDDLDRPLYGRYRQLQSSSGVQYEKHLAAAFYPKYGYGYARPLSYRGGAALGSIFKLVTAYEALVQRYRAMKTPSLEQLNPLTIEDRFFKQGQDHYIGYHHNGQPIPRFYRGGRLPRSLSSHIGTINIVSAIERSSNPYFSLLAGDILEDPDNLAAAARLFSFGAPTGAAVTAEVGGQVPDDLMENRTGLYALAIGQHSLVTTPLQAAVMLSAIANGGRVFEPRLVHLAAGVKPSGDHTPLSSYRYQDPAIPVATAPPPLPAPTITLFPSTTRRELFMPEIVRQILIEGTQRVVERSYQLAIGSLQQRYRDYPEAIHDFLAIRGQIAGKTSTAESVESLGLDRERSTNTYNHLWFGGIIFDEKKQSILFQDQFGQPELVVIVHLRYGAYGKDTIPIAAQVAQKWRSIVAARKESLPHSPSVHFPRISPPAQTKL